MNLIINEELGFSKNEIILLVKNFSENGRTLFDKGRNTIKIFEVDDELLNVKSFKIPNFINKVVYKYFRKSKAERSYNYAVILQKKGIGTPDPVAFFEEKSSATFGKSYYVSKQIDADLTYRELVQIPDYPNHEEILRAFTRFTFKLHENDILFLDHSPGNTLIKKGKNDYEFFLVDLNRIVFKELNETERIKNFCKLTPRKEMVEVMADEYSKLMKLPKNEVFDKMWFFTAQFQEKFHRKKQLKKKLKFWKN